jgi:hypothetical protein
MVVVCRGSCIVVVYGNNVRLRGSGVANGILHGSVYECSKSAAKKQCREHIGDIKELVSIRKGVHPKKWLIKKE